MIPLSGIIFCSGYRRTGKDTLYQNLCEGTSLSWRFVNPASRRALNILANQIATGTKILLRGAFADVLKEEIFRTYGITITEENKDIPILTDGRTGRDICIEVAAERRRGNPTYFADRLLEKYYVDINSPNILFITDWRYPNEFDQANLRFPTLPKITIRLYRSSIEIPTDPSEHQLDHFLFDHVLMGD